MGYDCSQRECNRGDDTRTLAPKHEVVTLYCKCQTTCSGTFRLAFRGQGTAPIAHGATNESFGAAIMALSPKVQSTRDVVYRPKTPVRVSFDGTNKAVCTNGGTTSTIEFLRNAGDLPPMWISERTSLKSTVANGVDIHFVSLSLDIECFEPPPPAFV